MKFCAVMPDNQPADDACTRGNDVGSSVVDEQEEAYVVMAVEDVVDQEDDEELEEKEDVEDVVDQEEDVECV